MSYPPFPGGGPPRRDYGPPVTSGPPRRRKPNVDFEWLARLNDKDFWAEIDRILSQWRDYTPSNKPQNNNPSQTPRR